MSSSALACLGSLVPVVSILRLQPHPILRVFRHLLLPSHFTTIFVISDNAANGRGNYPVAKDGLAFSVLVFLICALLCFAIILVRRATTGELGGNPAVKALSAFVMVMLWVIYVVLSS